MSDAASGVVRFDVEGHVAVITLDRPDARNAINGDVVAGLVAAVDRLERDDSLWVGILAANAAGQQRPVFCAGADLKEIQAGRGAALSTERDGFAGFVYRERRKPIIAAVDGLATAGGCELVLACDLVVASTRAAFGLAEVKRSLLAAGGGLFRLPRAIGQATAMEAILTGEPFPAERAHQLGLVSRLVEPGQALAAARALAGQIVANAPLAVWESRAVVRAAATGDDETLVRMTNEAMSRVARSADLAEGLAAFVEKRPPAWKAR